MGKHPSDEHCFALVVCELAEAIEADRAETKADLVCFETCMANAYKGEIRPDWYEFAYKRCIKGSIEEELADTVIRLLDLAGAHGYDLMRGGVMVGCIHNGRAFTENVWEIVQVLTSKRMTVQERIMSGVVAVEILAAAYEIDLWWHVQAKMRYNHNMPYKHGKKY